MNSSRHANRSNRGQASGRGRGRGRGGRQYDAGGGNGFVPTIQQVVVGAPVSIVLKVDQPTGREVQGFVGELLTRGNHPRGIKVRLQDGRVGRVQNMATEEAAKAGSEGLTGLGRNGETDGVRNGGEGTLSAAGRASSGVRYGDFRVDVADQPPREELSLADYVVTKPKGKHQLKKKALASSSGEDANPEAGFESSLQDTPTSAAIMCPVCGDFEGDEIAIAHHVNGHFE
jgi:uncharacterized repeat protein (TIGR03833 family)